MPLGGGYVTLDGSYGLAGVFMLGAMLITAGPAPSASSSFLGPRRETPPARKAFKGKPASERVEPSVEVEPVSRTSPNVLQTQPRTSRQPQAPVAPEPLPWPRVEVVRPLATRPSPQHRTLKGLV